MLHSHYENKGGSKERVTKEKKTILRSVRLIDSKEDFIFT